MIPNNLLKFNMGHGNWKWHPGIGDSFWKPSCIGSILNLRRVDYWKLKALIYNTPYSVRTSSHQQDIMLALEMLEASSWTIQIPYGCQKWNLRSQGLTFLFFGDQHVIDKYMSCKKPNGTSPKYSHSLLENDGWKMSVLEMRLHIFRGYVKFPGCNR